MKSLATAAAEQRCLLPDATLATLSHVSAVSDAPFTRYQSLATGRRQAGHQLCQPIFALRSTHAPVSRPWYSALVSGPHPLLERNAGTPSTHFVIWKGNSAGSSTKHRRDGPSIGQTCSFRLIVHARFPTCLLQFRKELRWGRSERSTDQASADLPPGSGRFDAHAVGHRGTGFALRISAPPLFSNRLAPPMSQNARHILAIYDEPSYSLTLSGDVAEWLKAAVC